MACPEHRLRYGRLWRLPTVRMLGLAAAAALVGAAAAAVLLPPMAAVAVLLVGAAGSGACAWLRRAGLTMEIRLIRALVAAAHGCPGEVAVAGLTGPVDARVRSDGVTEIEAGSWADAIRALGHAMGRDRGFQLDILRRSAGGRLAQVWGRAALPADRRYRALALAPAATRAADALEPPERELLDAFAAGVNAAWEQHGPPYECRFLGYRPARWKPADSLLVALLMYHSLSWNEPAKRAEAVTRAALPPRLADFLLPGADDVPLPAGLAGLRAAEPADGLVLVDRGVAGSNGWVRDGVLAGDLHLPLAMPNSLYEVDLRWPGGRVRGLAAAGLPVVLTGTNGRLSWTVTNLGADVLDLPPATGRRETRTERIRVRGREDVLLETERAGALPVSARPLLGERVALRWAGYDPRSLDLKLQRLAGAATVAEGVAILDDAQGIALNVLLTDAAGRIAHLATGLLPRRDGGFLPGAERPRLFDPAEGFLVSANDAALPEDATPILYDPDPGYRARRLRKLMADAPATGPAMRELQHDLDAEAYATYRDLAVAALRGRDDQLADLLAGWDGTAAGSRAFGMLVALRQILAQQVLGPYLTACREHDPGYTYPFQMVDRPLLAILRRRDPALLPRAAEPGGWDAFMAAAAARAADARWENAVGLRHPMESLAPWAAALIGVAPRPQPGALHAVRTCVPGFGSAGRAVFTTGPDGYAAVDLPGGQSGHPLSPHFTDRHEEWSEAPPQARRPPRARCGYVLRPAPAGHRGKAA
ncbi:penicillin acylase family protein [Rhizomonospora bruguierae]|uniref:penicillin acylase family protein n=1 Tax=Rhizomonospora bruguierae TaxID=1581705 RepID=UPI001BCFB0BA|nr:penicillin acylase family protein [Micromonospora sp. NBRC 107566]